LGLAFEAMVAALARSALGRDVRGTLDDTEICNKGDVIIVMEGSHPDLAAYLDTIRNSLPAEGFEQVLVPGDRSRRCRAERLRDGVPVADEIWSELQQTADALQEAKEREGWSWA
jgi:L-2-hydroxycarboxylate dehydrogenase (NAD+)